MIFFYRGILVSMAFGAAGILVSALYENTLRPFYVAVFCISVIIRSFLEYMESFEEGESAEMEVQMEADQETAVQSKPSPTKKEIKDRVRIPSSMQVLPCSCGGLPELSYDTPNDTFAFHCPACQKKSRGGFYLAEAIIYWNDSMKEGVK